MTGVERILVVRLGALGDVIHTLPAAASLKQSFPGARLVWAIEPRWAPLLAGNPHVDEVLPVERQTRGGLRAAWQALKAERFSLAVDFQGLIKSALVAFVGHPRHLYGFHQSQTRERLAALFYSHRVRTAGPHIVDMNLELAAAAGATARALVFPLPPGAPEGELPDGPFVLAGPLAGWAHKQWPAGYYEELARLLPVPLVLNGPPAAAAELRAIAGARVHLSGLPGLIDATRRAAAVVGVDSGPLHLAAALGKPGVAIFGPTDPARNGPYGGSLRVLRAPRAVTTYKRHATIDPSMAAISPRMVREALAL